MALDFSAAVEEAMSTTNVAEPVRTAVNEIEPGQPRAPIPQQVKDFGTNKELNLTEQNLGVEFDTDWHGWGNDEYGYMHVGQVPGRKSHALYLNRFGTSTILAYFKSEVEARAAMYWMDAFVQMFPKKEK